MSDKVDAKHLEAALHALCWFMRNAETGSSYTVPEDYRILKQLFDETGVKPSNAPSDDYIERKLNN